MFIHRFFVIPILFTMVIFLFAFTPDPKSISPVTSTVYENFTLNDYRGNDHSLSDYTGSRAIVLMFIATRCPVSNAYNSRMEGIYNKYKDQGVTFLGINSNKSEDVKEMAEHAKENSLTFPILKDEKNIIADVFEATKTPEIFVLSNKFELLYHGRIDDSQRESEIGTADLKNALDEILAGKEVSTPVTKAFGCSIKRI